MTTLHLRKGGRRPFSAAAVVLGIVLLVAVLSPAGAQDEPPVDAPTIHPLSPPWGVRPVSDGLPLKTSTGDSSDRFGQTVALSGDTAVVAAPAADVNGVRDAGAVYVYVRDGARWTEQARLTASNMAPWDNFGRALALEGDTLVVSGNVFNDQGAFDRGDVHIFVRDGTTWTEQAHLIASNAEAGDHFGFALGISGDTLVVSAPWEDSDGSGQNNNGAVDSGAAYVFTRNGTTWSQVAYLKTPEVVRAGDNFGFSVAVERDTVAVGAPLADGFVGSPIDHGEVDLFRGYGVWEWVNRLEASNAETGDRFGDSVSLKGNTIVVGAPGEDGNGSSESDNSAPDAGAAYVFTGTGDGRWFQRAYLKASNADAGDRFGVAVATEEEALIVGAECESSDGSSESDNSAEWAGAAYVFAGGGTNWAQVGYLKEPGAYSLGLFGNTVAMSNGQVAVGGDFYFYPSGLAYVYILDYQRGPTVRVSVDSSGNQGYDASHSPAISADGRYVAFVSEAKLVADDTVGGDENSDIYIHDRQLGQTSRVSVDSTGGQIDGWAWRPTISADGRYVAFQSDSDDLDGGQANSHDDVFVHDRQTGETRLVSADAAGHPGNHASWAASLSANGRYVAFASNASNLVGGDTQTCEDEYYGTISCPDIFVRDLQTGQTSRVSLSSTGEQGNAESYEPEISADGRYVVFQSAASNLVPGDTNGAVDVFVRDRQTGETTRISLSSAGAQGNGDSEDPVISADGRYVAFGSYARNLVSGDTQTCQDASNSEYNCPDIFVHDRQTGRTTRVSVNSAGNQANEVTYQPTISADGRYVGFYSRAANLVPGDTNDLGDVFVHDRYTGQTRRVSVGLGGRQGVGGASGSPAFSADGRYVAFDSSATNLVPGDLDGHDVFVHDLTKDDTVVTRASVNSAGGQAAAGVEAEFLSISANGRFVVFQSSARNLDSQHPACGAGSVYVHDRLMGRTVCVSTNEAGDRASFLTRGSTISANGRFVAFDSYTDGLVPGDTSGLTDVFVRDLQTGQLSLVSVNSAGVQGDNHSSSPSLSTDGRFVAFASAATNLVEGIAPTCGGPFVICNLIYVRDRQTGQTSLVSADSAGHPGIGWTGNPDISDDGRYVAFASDAVNLVSGDTNKAEDIFVRDRQTGQTSRISVDSAGGQSNDISMWPALSADGRYVAFTSYASNLVSGDTQMCPEPLVGEYNCGDIFVHDRQTGRTVRASVDSSGNQGNANSYRPAISADGRYVAFESEASNLVSGDTNGASDIFIHDLQTGRTARVSTNSAGGEGAGNAMIAAISADGRFVTFTSDASNLVSGDTNVARDVFVHDRGAVAAPAVPVDVSISLFSNPTTSAARAPYERLIGYFADAVYESSNGARKLGAVTFYTTNANLAGAHIIWTDRCWPSAQPAGYGVPGLHINMCDVFADGLGAGQDYNFLIDDAHQRGGGYTLGHEWGHYYFGLYDEYVGRSDWDTLFYFPHSTDVAVPNSIMNNQWQATVGDNKWLNFSIAKYDTRQTAQYRVYGASGWDTLIRPASADPRDGERLSLRARTYYADLLDVAPWANQDAAIQLPGSAALSELKIVWQPAAAAQPQDAAAAGYVAQLNSVLGQSIASPDPILLLAFVHKDRPLTGVGVQGSVRLPNGGSQPVTFTDDGRPPDARQGDGLYSAILGYRANGVYTVRVDFDNHAGRAAFVSTSFQPTTDVGGKPVPLPPPAPVSADFTAWTTLQVTVSGVTADDHGNAPGSARPIAADNAPWAGKIDKAGDKDVFRLTTLSSGVTYVRVSNLALGMNPRLRVFGPNGTTVLFSAGLDSSLSEYPFIPLTGVTPGTTVYVEVSHAAATAAGGLYEFSAGPKLPSDILRFRIFLPHTIR
jgi:Tol biopolymer transport system component